MLFTKNYHIYQVRIIDEGYDCITTSGYNEENRLGCGGQLWRFSVFIERVLRPQFLKLIAVSMYPPYIITCDKSKTNNNTKNKNFKIF